MNQARAFSDKEIVTIAAVAATALGGIVMSLGRGQETNSVPIASRTVVGDTVDRAREIARPVSSRMAARKDLPHRATVGSTISNVVRGLQDKAESSADSLREASRPEGVVDRIIEQVPSTENGVGSAFSQIAESLMSYGREFLSENRQQVERPNSQKVRSTISDLMHAVRSSGIPAKAVDSDKRGNDIRARVSTDVIPHRVDARIVPELVKMAGFKAGPVVQDRVAQPVSHAATRTSDVVRDSTAALAWLGLGAAVVYFGLLSEQRREQVKDALCGAIEQVRLLALDFQGYEPEM